MRDLGTLYRLELSRDELRFLRDAAVKFPMSWDTFHPNIDRVSYIARLERLLNDGET
jgi:hypothetical protein